MDWYLRITKSVVCKFEECLFYRIMPESVRWLVSQGRRNDAIKIINKAAKVNGVEVPKHLLEETNPEVVTESFFPTEKQFESVCPKHFAVMQIWYSSFNRV